MLKKIISGGQSGSDRAALDFAIANHIDHGGWCPKGRHAEDGPISAIYNLQETPDAGYNQRTAFNIRDSDGTVIFGITHEVESPGSRLTASLCRSFEKPFIYISPSSTNPGRQLWDFIQANKIETLNVAGTRASKAHSIGKFVQTVLGDALLK